MTPALCNAISPFEEMVSYETLWSVPKATVKSVAELFPQSGESLLPSEVLERQAEETLFGLQDLREKVERFLRPLTGFSVCVYRAFDYPERLREAKYPPEVFYYRGDIGLMESRCISIVGARRCSPEGRRRAAKLANGLVDRGYTIVSGLAAGVDTAAMTTAIEREGRTLGVIGTPITESYPRENEALQAEVASEHLLMSHVPFYRYKHESFRSHRFHFPARNVLMAALSEATVIVEASDTSGTLTQARACLQQGRKLFILNSCFENPDITWPKTYEERGAIRVREFGDIFSSLEEDDD